MGPLFAVRGKGVTGSFFAGIMETKDRTSALMWQKKGNKINCQFT